MDSRDGASRPRRGFGVARPRRDTTWLVPKPRRDFEELRPRRDTRLYINYFSLSQGCGVKIGSRSRMFLVGIETKVVFFKYAQARVAYLDVLELMRDPYLFLATLIPIFGELLKAIS